ncbi:MAG: hypothetical protein U9N56_05000 [Actinomycetota bacterium]|nr:hypothetical protein [Actinomycetota bacterium]
MSLSCGSRVLEILPIMQLGDNIGLTPVRLLRRSHASRVVTADADTHTDLDELMEGVGANPVNLNLMHHDRLSPYFPP